MRNPFSRKSQDDVLPTEIKEYYTSEQRDRTGATWLMGALVFVVTVVVVLAVFYGGRALYRTAFNSNETPTEQVGTAGFGDDEVEVEPAPAASTEEPAETDESAQSSEAEQENSADEQSAANDQTSPAPARTPNTGPSELPNTGPGN